MGQSPAFPQRNDGEPMNAWFGTTAWGSICDHMTHVATPVGKFCLHCEEAIQLGDEGQIIPHIDDGNVIQRPVHRECLIRMVVGSIGHQKKQCSCYNKNEAQEDQPGISKRQAAILACNYFESQHNWSKNG